MMVCLVFAAAVQVASLRAGESVPHAQVIRIDKNAISIIAAGYLERKVDVTSDATVYLMPDDQEQPQQYTFEAIYGRPDPLPDQEIQKIFSKEIGVVIDGKLLESPGFYDALIKTAKMYEGIRKSPRILLQESADVMFLARLDPNHWYFSVDPDAGAIAIAVVEDGVIVSGEMIFKCTDCFFGEHLERAVKHEMGHLLGFRGHPSSCDGVMGSPDPILNLSEKEELVFKYLFDRPKNTRPIDDSILRTHKSSKQKEEVVLCAIRPR